MPRSSAAFLHCLKNSLRAGIHLRGTDHALEPPAVVALGLIDNAERLLETGAEKADFIRTLPEPAIKDVVAVGRVPFAGTHHRADVRANAARDQGIEQIGVRQGTGRQLRNGGAAALQHLAERRLCCCPRALFVPFQQEGVFEELGHPEVLAGEVFEEPFEVQLVKAMNVQVHQARHDHQVRAVDDGVRTATVAPADEGHLVAGEDEVTVGYVCVLARLGVRADYPVGVLYPRRARHDVKPPLSVAWDARAFAARASAGSQSVRVLMLQ